MFEVFDSCIMTCPRVFHSVRRKDAIVILLLSRLVKCSFEFPVPHYGRLKNKKVQ